MINKILLLLLAPLFLYAENINNTNTIEYNFFTYYIDQNFKEFDEILKNLEDINIYDKDGNNILFYTIKNNDLKYTKKILQKGINVNHVNYYLQTPLLVASKIGNTNIIKILLDYQARIDSYDLYNQTPLDYAKQNNFYHSYLILKSYKKNRKQKKQVDSFEDFVKNFNLDPIDEI